MRTRPNGYDPSYRERTDYEVSGGNDRSYRGPYDSDIYENEIVDYGDGYDRNYISPAYSMNSGNYNAGRVRDRDYSDHEEYGSDHEDADRDIDQYDRNYPGQGQSGYRSRHSHNRMQNREDYRDERYANNTDRWHGYHDNRKYYDPSNQVYDNDYYRGFEEYNNSNRNADRWRGRPAW